MTIMKKENRNGMITITSEENEKFINETAAIMACQLVQMFYAQQKYLTTNTIDLETKKVELTVHYENLIVPTLPKGYQYTTKKLRSLQYWSNVSNNYERVRCIDYEFKF